MISPLWLGLACDPSSAGDSALEPSSDTDGCWGSTLLLSGDAPGAYLSFSGLTFDAEVGDLLVAGSEETVLQWDLDAGEPRGSLNFGAERNIYQVESMGSQVAVLLSDQVAVHALPEQDGAEHWRFPIESSGTWIGSHRIMAASEGFQTEGGSSLAVADDGYLGVGGVFVIPGETEGEVGLEDTVTTVQGPGGKGYLQLADPGDVDGDGLTDLLIGSVTFGGLWLLQGGSVGDYTIDDLPAFRAARPREISAAGDWDGDGRNDVAFGTISPETKVAVLAFDAAQLWDESPIAELPVDGDPSPYWMRLQGPAELDGDGFADLVLSYGDDEQRILAAYGPRGGDFVTLASGNSGRHGFLIELGEGLPDHSASIFVGDPDDDRGGVDAGAVFSLASCD